MNYANTLHERGLRPTMQRLAVYEYLLHHRTHPTAEEIFVALKREYPSFSRTTVYNALHALVETGLCRTVSIQSEELRFDGCAEDHAHARCRVCGEIWDMPLGEAEVSVPQGFVTEQTDLFLVGICQACAKQDTL